MTPVDLICLRCIHFTPFELGCKAFKEIPVERIVMKGHNHVYRDQIGKFVFEEDPDLSAPEGIKPDPMAV